MHKSKVLNISKVAATYAGTIMGAGFASGQELMQFFVFYGQMGLIGLLLVGCLFAWLGTYILEISNINKFTSYHQLLYHVCGQKIGLFLDSIITLSLFFVLTIMLAGAGTLCRDTLAIPYSLGVLIMTLLLIITALKGLDGITFTNFIITPLLAAATLSITAYSLYYHQFDYSLITVPAHNQELPAPHWLLASLLYLSYNLVMGITVLVPLGSYYQDRTTRTLGSILGGLLLGVLASFVTLVIMLHFTKVLDYEIPMLYIASEQHSFHFILYTFIFAAAMYTTALACLYGCATKLSSATNLSFLLSLSIILILSLIFSQIGFSNLIGIIFPIFGYSTLLFTIRICYLSFLSK